ncbi:MAG: agmatine deiminase [Alphaproteobacteria bacterium]|nr:agmatine deiminase [Alphaproteobacteria bacterium]
MSRTIEGSPRADGFRLPGEFEPHAGCWLLWPERPDTWRDGARPAQAAFAAVASAIAGFEPVTVGASPAQYRNARAMLPPAVRVVELQADDSWMRDTGPSFVINDAGLVRGVQFDVNAYGGREHGLYAPWENDRLVATKVLELERLDRYVAPLVLEGGAITSDGTGTLITTLDCVINDNRNPGRSRAAIEAILRDYLAAETIVWLPHGLMHDETGGHVDNIVSFVGPGVLLLAWSDDRADPSYERVREAQAILSRARDARGRAFEIHKLPLPRPTAMTSAEASTLTISTDAKARRAGDPVCASYINAYVGNGVVVVPTFDDPADEPARALYARLHLTRRIVQVPARELVLGGGGIHCITHEQPKPQGIPGRFIQLKS